MSIPTFPCYVGNQPRYINAELAVADKYTGEVIARVPKASPVVIDEAIGLAAAAAPAMRRLAACDRQAVLTHCATRIRQRADELIAWLCNEAGKPLRDSRGEVARLINTFSTAAAEVGRFCGEMVPLDAIERGRGFRGMVRRVPIGPCSFITPWNFPLNLVAHKIAPALAVGCPFVLKPSSRTPVSALLLGEILAETTLPPGAFSILPCDRDGAELFVVDERLKFLSFTGSPQAGWALKARAGKKRVTLELGGNAGCIVDADADLHDAVARITAGAFCQSGQTCISVQRVFIHRSVYESCRDRLVAAAQALVVGDPRDEATFVGPLISDEAAELLEQRVREAVAAGARLLCGGERQGRLFAPTLLENVPPSLAISCREAFGPVAVLAPFDAFSEALAAVNDSDYGLQAGVFTNTLAHAMLAWDELEVGGVMINEAPTWRVDNMPYGGVKESGQGREGVRYAMEEMTEPRLLALRV